MLAQGAEVAPGGGTGTMSGSSLGSFMRSEVEKVIEIIRPALQADGGDIELINVGDDGVVTVELTGACVSCPASTITMKAGVERILKDRVAGVTSVVQVGAGADPAETGEFA